MGDLLWGSFGGWSCGGEGALWGCDPRVVGELAAMDIGSYRSLHVINQITIHIAYKTLTGNRQKTS